MKKIFFALLAAAIFAAAASSQPNVSKKFADYGFELTSKSPRPSNNLRKEGVFQFKLNNPDVSVISALYEIGQKEPVPNATWTDRIGSDLTIVVDVPNQRQHRVVISAKKRGDKADFESVFYFDVIASEGYKGYGDGAACYPTPSSSYSELTGTHIISPISGVLQEGKVSRFAVQSTDFSKIGIRVNEKLVQLKKKGDSFELETKIPAGIDKIGLYGSKNGKNFTCMWTYKVQKDPPPAKYRIDDDEEEPKNKDITDKLPDIFSNSGAQTPAAGQAQAPAIPQTTEKPTVTNQAVAANEDAWNLTKLDTARNVNYMTDLEKDIVLEMNMARSDPKKYAALYVAPRAAKFNGLLYDRRLKTAEGVAAVNECVSVMSAQESLPPFQPSKGLTRAAKDQARMQSVTDQVGHEGTDGSSPFDRIKRYGSYMTAGENIDYGSSSAREIVLSLLVDDGVASRGHRKNIMNKAFTTVGVGYADAHKKYRCMCVIDFTGKFNEKR